MPPLDMPCRQCGKPTKRRHKRTGKPLCLECALHNAATAARQMHEQQGPAWDRFVAVTGARGRENAPRDSKGRFLPDRADGSA